MLRKFLILPLIFFCIYTSGQVPTDTLFEDVRVTLKNWNEVHGSALWFDKEGSNVFLLDKPDFTINYELKDVFTIEAETGSKALLHSVFGAAAGVLGWYAIYRLSDWDDPLNDVSSATISTTFFVCTGAGLGIGFLIGRKQKKYKAIYKDGQFISP